MLYFKAHLLKLYAGYYLVSQQIFATFYYGLQYIVIFSLSDTWINCLSGQADFKELIPEFYEGSGDYLLANKVSLDEWMHIKMEG